MANLECSPFLTGKCNFLVALTVVYLPRFIQHEENVINPMQQGKSSFQIYVLYKISKIESFKFNSQIHGISTSKFCPERWY